MSKLGKKIICLALAATMLVGTTVSAFAEEVQGDVQEDAPITVEEGDKPYISFGADLTGDEKAAVLGLFGITEADLANYDVYTVTNEDEHKYLDDYLEKGVIGTRALSSVLVKESDSSGIHVETKNITYCTPGMYENALATVGVKDVDVIVAGPFGISGTAALIGATQAYAGMTGKDIDADIIDGAIEEIVVTGKIEEQIGSNEEIEGLIADVKEQIASGEISEDEIEQAVKDGAQEMNLTLTDEQVRMIVEMLEKLSKLDLDPAVIKARAEKIYTTLKGLGIDLASKEGQEKALGLFEKIYKFIMSIFGK